MPQIGEVRGETIRSLVGSGNPLPLGFAVVERGHIEDPAARSSTNRYESIDNGDAFGAIGQNSRSPGHSSGCLPPELPLGLAVVGVWEPTGPAASSARSRKTDRFTMIQAVFSLVPSCRCTTRSRRGGY